MELLQSIEFGFARCRLGIDRKRRWGLRRSIPLMSFP